MNDLIASFIAHLRHVKKYSEMTASSYEIDLADFSKFAREYGGDEIKIGDLAGLDATMFRAWLADRQHRGLAMRSSARAMSALRSFYKWLKLKHGIKNESIGLVRSPKFAKSVPHALDATAITSMNDVIRELEPVSWLAARNRAILMLIFGSGMRISEALGLTINQIASRPDVLQIKGKGKKERIVPILPVVWKSIDEYLKLRPFTHLPCVFDSATGLPMTPRMAQKMVEGLRVALQLPDWTTPHALRHSFATALLTDGVDLRSIQELLGHARLSATQIYTKVADADIFAAYNTAHPRASD